MLGCDLRLSRVGRNSPHLRLDRVRLLRSPRALQSLHQQNRFQIVRIDLQCMRQLGDRHVRLPLTQRQHTRTHQRCSIIGIQLQSVLVTFIRLIVFMHLQVSLSNSAPRRGPNLAIGSRSQNRRTVVQRLRRMTD